MNRLPRRDFLRAGLAGGALLLSGESHARSAPPQRRGEGNRPARNIIFMVSDGMSLGTLTMADLYQRTHHGRSTRWIDLYRRSDVRRALIDTSSASSPVTDSAAASSAWGCGHKVLNGSVNVDPTGRPRTPIMHLARAAGLGTGLVTTATVTHATPAGFAAQAVTRTDEDGIARQYLDLGVDVLLGGGTKFFDGTQRADGVDLFAAYATAGYRVARDRAALLNRTTRADRLLGVFAEGYLPFSLDHRAEPALVASVPTLAEMTRAGLAHLAAHPGGFLLQVEGGRIDSAAHANDIGGLIHDQLAFDDAIGEVLEFVSERDDTLVVVTTDHGNANPALNGSGGNFDSRGGSYGDTKACFDRVAQFRRTNSWVMSGLDADSPEAHVRERVLEATQIELAPDELDMLRRALRHEHSEGYRVRNAPLITLAQILANYTSVGWTGTQHTADFAEFAAFGPGTESIGGMMQNTDLFSMMTRALALREAGV